MVFLTPQRTKNRRYLCACVSRFQIFCGQPTWKPLYWRSSIKWPGNETGNGLGMKLEMTWEWNWKWPGNETGNGLGMKLETDWVVKTRHQESYLELSPQRSSQHRCGPLSIISCWSVLVIVQSATGASSREGNTEQIVKEQDLVNGWRTLTSQYLLFVMNF